MELEPEISGFEKTDGVGFSFLAKAIVEFVTCEMAPLFLLRNGPLNIALEWWYL